MDGRKLWALLILAGMLLPVQAQEVFYLHTDALGSVVAETDANRNVIERSEYEPYGKVLNRAVKNGPGYTGHVEDAATGLTYMQQRYYDPTLGRFLSVDPVTADSNSGGNFNRYWYANNNPYRFTDPDGRQSSESVMDRRYVYPHLNPDQVAGIEAQHNEIGERAFDGAVVGASLVPGSMGLAALGRLSSSHKFTAVLALSLLDPNPEGQKRFPGKGQIAAAIQAARSIAKVAEKAKAIIRGSGSAVVPSGITPGQSLGGGASVRSTNQEAGTAKVRMAPETGSRIRKTVEVCVDKKKCG